MRIYGKTFSEIFGEMPWPYKIVVVAGGLFLLVIVFNFTSIALNSKGGDKASIPIQVSGHNSRNILDPSLAADAERAYLAFTGIENGNLTTWLATAGFPCRSWQSLGKVFEVKPEDLLAPDGQSVLASGAWRYETPSLVYDPADPGREWKIYAYKYFWAGNAALARRYGVIVFKYAPAPTGKWSTEEWVLAAAPDYPPPPYQGLANAFINALSPALSTYAAYARPSVVAVNGYLLMTLSALRDKSAPTDIVMLGSADHGRTWVYMGTPLSQDDARKVGPYTRLGGASLFSSGGKIYLAAVFGDDQTDGLGTFVLDFKDVSSGTLARDEKGAPVVLRHIPLQSLSPTPTGGGYAAHSDPCDHGMLTSEHSGVTGAFQIFKTFQTPLEGAE